MGRFELVPNFSEGRRPGVVDAIAGAMAAVSGVWLLDREMDADHNRCVVTLAGEGAALVEAALAGAREALGRIDLNTHRGEHPRMGAMDVCPFVPLAGSTMAEAVALARAAGERLGRELGLPVFLYEEAATRPERRNLADVRKGQFEGLRELIGVDPARTPDFGPAAIHPTAGAVAVGARFFLVAYNINLETREVKLAKAIAKAVREKDGGLPCVKAMGFFLEDQGLAQVSMNLTNYRSTSIARVFEAVEAAAGRAGVAVRESELVGLVPAEALDAETAARVRLARFNADEQILERRLERAARA